MVPRILSCYSKPPSRRAAESHVDRSTVLAASIGSEGSRCRPATLSQSYSTPTRLVPFFAGSLLLLLCASLIVGHFRHKAILGQLAEINRGVTNKPIEHRSVSTT